MLLMVFCLYIDFISYKGSANKLPGVIHLPIKTKPHITELLSIKTVMKKRRQVLRSALHRFPDKALPSNNSQLANQFAAFFTNKMAKIRESFSSSSCHLL